MGPISQPTHLRVRFEGTDRGSATVRLLWDAAPKTCAAIVAMLDGDGRLRVQAVHGRHSGHEALFLTPKLCTLGDENTTLDYELGDFLFGYEPAGICQHGDVSVSEVAWIYGPTAQPRRWVSTNGDPKNKTPPFRTTDVPLNRWAVVEEEHGFYAASGQLPRTGARALVVETVVDRPVARRSDEHYMAVAFEEALAGMAEGGVPVGACLVSEEGEVLGRGRNGRVQHGSAILHGETAAIENAGRLSAATLRGSTLYTTLSPCAMCAGAALLYGIPRVVVADNESFEASEAYLRSRGVTVDVLDTVPKIGETFRGWAKCHPCLWSEDIGEPAPKKAKR